MRSDAATRVTSNSKRQLISERLNLHSRGINRFVEKFTEAVDVGQFGGAALDEGAVARAAARPNP